MALDAKDLATGYAAIVATISLGWNIYLECVRKGKQRKALAGSLLAELEALEELYKKVELNPWRGESTVYNLVNIQEDYLKIFNSNCDKIGLFNNDDASEIVKKYVYFKGYMDTLRLLSEEWRKFQERARTLQLGQYTQQQHQALNIQFESLSGLYSIAFQEQKNFYKALNEIKPLLKIHLHCPSKIDKMINSLLFYPRKIHSYFE